MLVANRRTSNRRAARQTFRPRFEPLESRIMLSAAVLSGWVGLNNTAGANDYAVISSTSAGGTFQSRSAVEAELGDAALLGGPFGFDTDLFMSGTLAFANPDDAPANFFFGFYGSAGTTFPNAPRLGLSLGNQSADFFRMQSVANNGSTTVTNNLNFGSGTAGEPLAAGTYPFHFTYTASNRQLSATVGPLTRTITLLAGFNQAGILDRFGFRQWPTTPVSDIAFALTVSDINYTGEMQVTGPPTEPAAPTGLAATAGEGQVSLTWQDNSDNETGSAIERRVGSDGTWHPLATVPANVTSYTDLGLAPETTYYYRLRAFHGDLFSEWSNEASATTPVGAPQDHLIPAHGEYSQTYLESWETLPSGKEIIQARPEPPPAIAVMDGMHNGVDYREVPVVDGVATLKDLHLELSWTQGESQVHDRPSVSTMWFFTGMDKVIIDNVTVRQMTPDKAANTIRIYNVDTVEIRNSTFEGDVRRYHIMLHGVKNIFIDGVEVKGDVEGNAGGGIVVENGGGRASGQPIPLGPLEWLVIQNSYFHDATTIAGGPTAGNRDAILVHTFNNGVIFNNTFENWIHSAKEGSTAIDAAVDIGLRVAHPPEHEAITRIERNQFINNTFVKSNGSAGGDTNLRHHLLWVNNEFLNTGLVDYHANFTVHYVHNTFVFDAAKSGPKLTTIFPFHTWFGSAPDGSHVKVFNNIISQKEITGPFTPFRLYEQRASDGNAQSHHLTLTSDYNWIDGAIPRWMQTNGSGGWVSTTYEDWKTRGLPRTVFDEHSQIGPINFDDYANNQFSLAEARAPSFAVSSAYTAAEQTLVALRVLRDFKGAMRGATPTIGAHQFD